MISSTKELYSFHLFSAVPGKMTDQEKQITSLQCPPLQGSSVENKMVAKQEKMGCTG